MEKYNWIIDQMPKATLLATISAFPMGYSEVVYFGKKYGVSLAVYNSGKSYKLYAEEHDGKNVISFNFYLTGNAECLRPCEMSDTKVLDFLYNSKPEYV